MAIKDDREYRNLGLLELETREQDEQGGNEPSFFVEGYASTFEPYKLLTFDGVDYYERIEPTAFANTDLSDVVFLRDHEGRVLARTKNGTIELSVDNIGLHTRTDLGKTGASREMFEDIQARNYTQMSFSFIVDDDEYEEETHTRVIKSIKKLYDISAVAFPANPGTNIGLSMRDYFDGAIERAQAERLAAERQAQAIEKLKLKLKLGGINK